MPTCKKPFSKWRPFKMAAFQTNLNKDSDLIELRKQFAPFYSDNGQLVSVKNIPCIRKFCNIEKQNSPEDRQILKKIVLHPSLRSRFDLPKKYQNSELYPCCICPVHFEDKILNQLKEGSLPETYPEEIFNFEKKKKFQKLEPTKSGRIFSVYSPILRRLIENPPEKSSEFLDQNFPIDNFFSDLLESTPEPWLNSFSPSTVEVNPGIDITSIEVQPQDPSVEVEVTNLTNQDNVTSVLPKSFFDSVTEIVEQNSDRISLTDKNLFTLFDLKTTIQNLKFDLQIDLHLIKKIHAVCTSDTNLALEYKTSSQQEILGTFGKCNIIFSQPYTCIKESQISLSFLLEQEIIHKLSKPEFLLPLVSQASNEFIYRKFLHSTLKLHLEAFLSVVDLVPQNSYYIISEVLQALHYLHENSIIFNNIEPKSIFVHENQIKIGNFEFAVLENFQCFQSCNLSFPYKSPELANCLPYYCNSDIWSVGVLLAFLLSKIVHCPFTNMTYESLSMNTTTFIGSNSVYQFSEEDFSFIQLCLTENPKERPTSAYFLNHRFLNEKKWF